MLLELRVRGLGVVDDMSLLFDSGMTVVTGETGAGKTMIVEAIRLLTGGRGDPQFVRAGHDEAWIEGRFLRSSEAAVGSSDEAVLTRVIPREGRTRAYVDGKMVPVASLVELGEELVDLHGQHAQHALFSSATQRRALDEFGGIDTSELSELRATIRRVTAEIERLGGDAQARVREIDLLRYQLDELEAAEITDAGEVERLASEEFLLANAETLRLSAASIHETLAGDGGVQEMLGIARKTAEGTEILAPLNQRLSSVLAEIADIVAEAAAAEDRALDNPERLAEIHDRRAMLNTLMRKYGPTLADVIEFGRSTVARFNEVTHHDETLERLEAQRTQLQTKLATVEKKVASQRRAAAPALASAVEERLHDLALPHGRFEVAVAGPGAQDDVTFLLGPNPGMPALPLAKAASGGELARSMLALRLALMGTSVDASVDTLIFDEVDAGIGGEAAATVGKALAALGVGPRAQVLVVTHLAQVAAFADHQVVVEKDQTKGQTVTNVSTVVDIDREVELARMLSGRPDSKSGRAHARELLEQARNVTT